MSFIRLRSTSSLLLVVAMFFSATFSLRLMADGEWVEGQHYRVITPPVAVGASDEVVVTEFFWYGCGHCYTFEPMLTVIRVKPRPPLLGHEPLHAFARLFAPGWC